MIRKRCVVLLVCLLTLAPLAGRSQDSSGTSVEVIEIIDADEAIDEAVEGVSSESKDVPVEISVPEVIEYLQRDIFIIPGKGLKRIRLGMPMAKVIATWGQPLKQKTGGIFKREYQWLFRGEDGTLINVTGHRSVDRIGFFGSPSGIYQTTQGARFGMFPHEITSIYGMPAGKQKTNQVSYPHLGIIFGFRNGRTERMTIESVALSKN